MNGYIINTVKLLRRPSVVKLDIAYNKTMILNLLLVFIFCCGTALAEVPISDCDIVDLNFNECYKKFLSDEFLKKLVHEGIPDLSIPALNPLHINTTRITADTPFAEGYLVADAFIKARDQGNVVESFKAEAKGFPHMKFKLVIFNSKMDMTGSYDTELLVNEYNITGTGNYSMILDNAKTTIEGQGLITRGHDHYPYLSLSKLSVYSELKNATDIEVTGLLPDDPVLGQKVVETLNRFSLDFLKEIYPTLKPKIRDIIYADLKKYFDNTPINKFNPPIGQ